MPEPPSPPTSRTWSFVTPSGTTKVCSAPVKPKVWVTACAAAAKRAALASSPVASESAAILSGLAARWSIPMAATLSEANFEVNPLPRLC